MYIIHPLTGTRLSLQKKTGRKLSSIYLFIEIIKNCVPQIEVTIKLNDKAWLRIKKGNKKTRLAVNLIVFIGDVLPDDFTSF
jgi:hypothetical protein